jgi:hypothetical protein
VVAIVLLLLVLSWRVLRLSPLSCDTMTTSAASSQLAVWFIDNARCCSANDTNQKRIALQNFNAAK